MRNDLAANYYMCGSNVEFPKFAAAAAEAGMSAVGLTAALVSEMGTGALRRCLAENGLAVSSLNSVGYFTDPDRARIDRHNLELLDAAAELDAGVLCVICGGLGEPPLTVTDARTEVRRRFDALARRAGETGVTLGVEPIHPMDVLSKGCVNSVAQALDLVHGHPSAGLILDFYHSWWDADLVPVVRDAPDSVALVQVCDVRTAGGVPAGRETPGRGMLPVGSMARDLIAAGYEKPFELELFEHDLSGRDPLDVLSRFPGQFEAALSG